MAQIAVVSSKERYRELAAHDVREGESVLEIGCSTGGATRRLAKRASRVLAVDVSSELVDRLRRELADVEHVAVRVMDGRDVEAMAAILPSPDVVFVDIGGNALLPNVTTVLRGCLRRFSPRLAVVRSFELADLASAIASVERRDGNDVEPFGELDRLLSLSHSYLASDRAYAARRLAGLRTKEALDRLAEMADDIERRVRWSAAKALEARESSG